MPIIAHLCYYPLLSSTYVIIQAIRPSHDEIIARELSLIYAPAYMITSYVQSIITADTISGKLLFDVTAFAAKHVHANFQFIRRFHLQNTHTNTGDELFVNVKIELQARKGRTTESPCGLR